MNQLKPSIFKFGLISFLLFQSLFSLADFKDEILKLTRIDLLPQFQKDVAVKQLSSYDTTGGNDDGFSGKYSFLRKENGTLVIADLKGSGVIQRIWTPTPSEDTIQFYFDGESKPRIELKFIDLFSGKNYPFVRPIVGNEVGGYYCYLPIPYKTACKIVCRGKVMQFFQIQYREKSGLAGSSFPQKLSKVEDQALSTVIGVWKKSGENILSLLSETTTNQKTISQDIVMKPGEIKSVFSQSSGGRIVGIEITPKLHLNDQFKDLILRARWDKEAVAAINCPAADFFGYGFGKPSMQSMILGVRDGIHYCYIPMPFDKDANLELEFLKSPLNQSSEIAMNVKIYYNETKRSENEGKFYAEWKREKNVEMGKPYQILNKTGRGHYVGTLLQSQGINPGMTLFFEGDDICTVDGQMRLHGTGSEDYFNGGWYALPDRWDQAYSLPTHGCLAYSIPLAHTGAYRLFMTDKISFEHDFNLTIEHGPSNNQIPADYTSVALYYCNIPPASNNLPSSDLLEKIKSPKTLEYWIEMLTVKALGENTRIATEQCKDAKTKHSYYIYKLEGPTDSYAKFELEVPSNGEYKLYLSYLKGPDCGPVEINQRQIPIKQIEGLATENTFIEKEFIGNIWIKDGTNTMTITLKDNPNKSGKNTFLLHRIYLEKTF